jgi:CIC family chloride channel protein
LAKLIEQYPYRYFPVMAERELQGVASRSEIELALREHRALKLEPAVTCPPRQTIRESQTLLLQSTTGTIAISEDGKTLLGILTLHDLLRAQLAAAEREGSS